MRNGNRFWPKYTHKHTHTQARVARIANYHRQILYRVFFWVTHGQRILYFISFFRVPFRALKEGAAEDNSVSLWRKMKSGVVSGRPAKIENVTPENCLSNDKNGFIFCMAVLRIFSFFPNRCWSFSLSRLATSFYYIFIFLPTRPLPLPCCSQQIRAHILWSTNNIQKKKGQKWSTDGKDKSCGTMPKKLKITFVGIFRRCPAICFEPSFVHFFRQRSEKEGGGWR